MGVYEESGVQVHVRRVSSEQFQAPYGGSSEGRSDCGVLLSSGEEEVPCWPGYLKEPRENKGTQFFKARVASPELFMSVEEEPQERVRDNSVLDGAREKRQTKEHRQSHRNLVAQALGGKTSPGTRPGTCFWLSRAPLRGGLNDRLPHRRRWRCMSRNVFVGIWI